MRVVYLHQYFNTPDMPGGTRSYELARRLSAMGHSIFMVTSDRTGEVVEGRPWRVTSEAGIEVHWTPVLYSNELSFRHRSIAFFKFAIRAARRASSLNPDIVFATSTPLTIAVPGVYTSRCNGVPMVFEVRDVWPEVPIAIGALRNPIAKSGARSLARFAYRNSQRIVVLAPGMKDDIVRYGYPAERIHVIPNGSDVELFDPTTTAGEVLRGQLAWLQDRPLVLYCGALGLVNGVDYLVEIAHAALTLDSEVRFVVLGSGREEPRIRHLASQRGVLGNNFFLLGKVPKREVPAWLSAATMSIALFKGPREVWKDATQNKFFDSLAAGRPIASNFSGWQAQISVEENVGLIIDPNDPKQAAGILLQKVRDRHWLASAGDRARRLAETRFARDGHAAELEHILLGAIDEAHARQ